MQYDDRDDFNARAIPTAPGQRAAQPSENYDTAPVTRIPRQPGPDQTDNR